MGCRAAAQGCQRVTGIAQGPAGVDGAAVPGAARSADPVGQQAAEARAVGAGQHLGRCLLEGEHVGQLGADRGDQLVGGDAVGVEVGRHDPHPRRWPDVAWLWFGGDPGGKPGEVGGEQHDRDHGRTTHPGGKGGDRARADEDADIRGSGQQQRCARVRGDGQQRGKRGLPAPRAQDGEERQADDRAVNGAVDRDPPRPAKPARPSRGTRGRGDGDAAVRLAASHDLGFYLLGVSAQHQPSMRYDGRIVLNTSGSRGIGRRLASDPAAAFTEALYTEVHRDAIDVLTVYPAVTR